MLKIALKKNDYLILIARCITQFKRQRMTKLIRNGEIIDTMLFILGSRTQKAKNYLNSIVRARKMASGERCD